MIPAAAAASLRSGGSSPFSRPRFPQRANLTAVAPLTAPAAPFLRQNRLHCSKGSTNRWGGGGLGICHPPSSATTTKSERNSRERKTAERTKQMGGGRRTKEGERERIALRGIERNQRTPPLSLLRDKAKILFYPLQQYRRNQHVRYDVVPSNLSRPMQNRRSRFHTARYLTPSRTVKKIS